MPILGIPVAIISAVMLWATAGAMPQHSAEAAAATANAELAADHYKAYGAEWHLLSRETKRVISERDWVTLFTTCFGTEPQPGEPVHVVQTTVRGNVATFTFSMPLRPDDAGQAVFESNGWRWQPSPGHMRLYRLGAAGAIAELRAAGRCSGK